ncbi:MAG TPA: hypothetical protein VGS22_20910 [Thermoanaerobaculia bacterium]|nr:hypothetical protein [Thermoanaerobaculia bacterium]
MIAYLDERFQRIDQRFERIDQRLEQIDGRFKRVEDRLDALDTAIRHTNVLVESLRGDVHLIAEGFVGLSDRFNTFQSEATLVFDQVKGWIEPYYRNLDGRLRVVEGRAERQQGDVLDAVRRMLGKPPLQPLPSSD